MDVGGDKKFGFRQREKLEVELEKIGGRGK